MLKVAIVGLGPHGKRMMRIINKMKDLNLVAVVDKSKSAFYDVELASVKQYLDIKEIFSHHELDLLVITTNGPSHYQLAKYAIENGIKRLLVSKPLTTTLGESRHLLELADKHSVRIAVDHGLRHDKTYNWIKSNIIKKVWGELRSIYVMRHGIGLGCLGVHSFDLVNYLADSEVQSVVGWVDKPIKMNPRGEQYIDPGGLVILNYENGTKGIISQIEDGAGPMSVEINLTGARIRVNEKYGEVDIVTKDPNEIGKPGKPVPYNRLDIPEDVAVSHNIFELMESILIELISDEPLKCDIQHGEKSLELLVATYLSDENGHSPILLPLTEESSLNKFLPVT